jgi:uncharacterized protein (DUF1330 family)
MAAYVISEVEVLNEPLADRYRSLAQQSIARYQGRYLVRGAVPDAVEGEWPSEKRLVVVEFPTIEKAHEWYASSEYVQTLDIRTVALARRLLFAKGVTSD